jgi:hypothetical protein
MVKERSYYNNGNAESNTRAIPTVVYSLLKFRVSLDVMLTAPTKVQKPARSRTSDKACNGLISLSTSSAMGTGIVVSMWE